MLRESLVTVDGLRLNHVVGPPQGPPVLLLHGVLRRWQTFHPLLPHLLPRWQLHSIDFPGHGASDRLAAQCRLSLRESSDAFAERKPTLPTGEYCVRDYIRTTVDFIRQVLTEPIVIYGHSLGAMVAAGVAEKLGDQVRALVLEDPPLDTMGPRIRETPLHSYFNGLRHWAGSQAPRDEIAQQLAQLVYMDPQTGVELRLGDQRDPAQLRFMASCLAQLDPRVLDPIVKCRWLEGFLWRDMFEQLSCPTLLLQADTTVGGMLTDADAQQVVHAARNCSIVKLSGCGHGMHWSRTQDVANLTNAFLESL